MLDRSVRILERRRAQRNKTLQPLRNPFVRVSLRVSITPLLAQIARQGAIQVDDLVAAPCADAALWTIENDFHARPPVFILNPLLALPIPHLYPLPSREMKFFFKPPPF